MIEKDIRTWDEFKTALTEKITENVTYNIKNNLDASNDILTDNIKCVNSDYKKEFKGNNYTINGITAYGNVTVFYTKQSENCDFHFYDIKFTNFMVDSGTFTNLCHTSGILFKNCFFNGVCKIFIDSASGGKIEYFYKCSLNVRCENLASSNSTFDSCYIIVTPLQDTNTFSNFVILKDSYAEGTIKSSFASNSPLTPKFIGNNVFNCKVIITNYSNSTTYKVNTTDSATLINKDKLLQSDGVTPITNIKSANNVFFLTDEQLKNKDHIQQNTTFPLYG